MITTGTLVLTDGTDRVDLLNTFCLFNWTPATAEAKGGGVWRSSPFTQGRQLVLKKYANIIDTFELQALGGDVDALIRNTQDARRLLEKAVDYWETEWQNEPVWLETRGICETNPRYAIIHDYATPNDDDPFGSPMSTDAVMENWTLIIEHGLWNDAAPGSSICVAASGSSNLWCYPHYLSFSESGDEVDCGSNAILDDLPTGDFTVDGWIYADGYGGSNAGRIIDKQNMYITTFNAAGILAYANFDVTDAQSASGLDDFDADSIWHHIAAVFDSATKTFSLYIDGVEPSYTSQNAGANNYVSDAASNFRIGNNAGNTAVFDGKIGWLRVSDTQRFLADFDKAVPPRCTLPTIDGNTLAVWIYEGTGGIANNLEGTAALNGTITGADWGCDCECGT